MKIAMVIRRLDVKGGTQRLFLYLANQFRARGHEVTIYPFFYSKEACYPDLLEGFDVIALDPQQARDPEYKTLRSIPLGRYAATLLTMGHETRSARAMAKLIKPDVDLLNVHDRVAHRAVKFFRARVTRRVPAVWNTNDTHSMRHLVDKLAAVDPDRYVQPLLKQWIYRMRDAYENWRFIRPLDAIVVVDKFNQKAVRDYFGREAFVARNGPNLAQFTYKPRTAPKDKKVNLLTSGIFFPHRRFEDAIRATRILADQGYDAILRIIGDPAGDPEYAARLFKLVDELKLAERVIFLKRISEKELIERYHEADIFLYPHTMQSDGLAPTEAMACGLVPVVSRGAGIHEIIDEEKNGLLANAMDPADIARSVRALVDDPARYERISAYAAEFVRRTFTWEKYADRELAIFEHVLKGAPLTADPERRE
ncbi:glycosyltransferase family 1 protein [Candidatus Parcubacteria bacterium]|nr:MAG: glycosyltransferase family 1 protein [Candidatus Parcubacteria bacterium]